MNLPNFYWTKEWRKTAALYMESRGHICERCGRLAHIIHHRQYVTPENVNDTDITLNWDNLEALCMECHNIEHCAGESVADGLRFNESGDIVKINN